ncbi:MAG: HesA/MoeB/ThiF family protein [Deltaproteobacteria bacterium]|nr:HesA/MoeB/ThiF family protein [Deltaproteobacteria bacterium]
MADELSGFLRSAALGGLVDWQSYETAAQLFGVSWPEIERAVLAAGLFPRRYAAQRRLLGQEGQQRLLAARVTVVGCGGLGGWVVEILARAGVGRLRLIDPDTFDESNLNRQLGATIADLGRPKVEVLAARVAAVNPVVQVTPLAATFREDAGDSLLAGSTLVIDGLDTVAARLELGRCCRRLALPLVHGAVEGWYGQAAVQAPGAALLAAIYPQPAAPAPPAESRPDSLAAVVANVASLQAALALQAILAPEDPFPPGWLMLDLREPELERIVPAAG